MPDSELNAWFNLFEPLGKSLADSPLRQINEFDDCSESQQINALKGAMLLRENIRVRHLDASTDCDDFELSLISEHLRGYREVFGRKLHELHDSLSKEASEEPGKLLRAPKRSEIKPANCAIALALMGDLQAADQAFQENASPTLRTLVIHGLAKQSLPWSALIEELSALESKHDPFSANVKFGLLQVFSAESC